MTRWQHIAKWFGIFVVAFTAPAAIAYFLGPLAAMFVIIAVAAFRVGTLMWQAQQRGAQHAHTDDCWEPDSGCDMGRNEAFAIRSTKGSA